MFYLIVTEYVGPNKRDSKGNIIGDSAIALIRREPSRTNSSREVLIEGWLGTTNDQDTHAHGEFETLDEARGAAADLGYTHRRDDVDGFDESTVEAYVSAAAARAQWDADDWLHGLCDHNTTREQYGITAATTDAELNAAISTAINEAIADGVELHGTPELFYELRREARVVNLVQEPYLADNQYEASGYLEIEDRDEHTGPTVTVRWSILEDYDAADGDESHACDWSAPVSVTHYTLGDLVNIAEVDY